MGKPKKLRQKYRTLCFHNRVIMKNLDRIHNTKFEAKSGTCDDSDCKYKMDTRLDSSNPIQNPCLRRKLDIILAKPNRKAKHHLDKVQISRKKGNTHQKGVHKRRQKALVRDLNCFKKTMKEESFVENPHAMVMNQTMSKLSSEYFENSQQNVLQ